MPFTRSSTFVTELGNAEDAVKAYIGGNMANHTERLH